MASLDPTSQSFVPSDTSQYTEESDIGELTPPRIPLFVPSDPWVPCDQALVGYYGYAPSRYLCGFEMAVPEADIGPYDHYRDYTNDTSLPTMTTFDPDAPEFALVDSDEQFREPKSSKLTPTAPAFVPVKSLKLDAQASSFLLSRLAIFDPPADDLGKRPRKCTLVLPDARKDKITDSIEMLQCPQDGQVGRFKRDTTLKFNNGWHHNDPVLAAMYYTMRALKKKSFDIFASNPGIRPVNDAPPLWPPPLNLFDIKAYYFKSKEHDEDNKRCDGEEEAKWVTILPNGSPPTGETIHLYETDEEKWVTFSDWLEKTSTLRRWTGRTGFDLQFAWYKSKRSKHRFEDLPAEMRERIYRVALGGHVYPLSSLCGTYSTIYRSSDESVRSDGQLTLGLGYHRALFSGSRRRTQSLLNYPYSSHLADERPFVYAPNLELSAVNHKIRDEFLHYAWVHMRSRFFNSYVFDVTIDAKAGSAMAYKHLSKIELSFTTAEWFRFFDVYPMPAIKIAADVSLGPRLQALDNLHDVHLRFRSPYDGYSGDPWGHEDAKRYLPRYGGLCYVSCQRTMVDWICTFAYPFLIDKCKDDKLKVTLTGAVKTDTKQKWEAIFKNKREHNHEEALEAIKAIPGEELPPQCNCGTVCSFPYESRVERGYRFRTGDRFDPDS